MPLSHIRQDVDLLQLPSSGNCQDEFERLAKSLAAESSLSIVSQNITAYIAGFVTRRLLQVTACDSCKAALIDNGSHTVPLIDMKNRGGLVRPSRDLCRLVADAESRLRCIGLRVLQQQQQQILVAVAVRAAVSAGIFSTLRCIEASNESHRYFILRRATEIFLRVRVFHIIRQQNSLKSSVRQQLTKKVIFMGQ